MREDLKTWLGKLLAVDEEDEGVFDEVDGLMAEAGRMCSGEPAKWQYGVENMMWLWKHLKHTPFDVGSGSDNQCDVLYIIWQMADRMLVDMDAVKD